MTQDEIIRMAREAGLLTEDEVWVSPHQEAMERFAALVAAHEREKQAEQAEQEPVYAFRRKGQDSFCTCDKERYEELADKPNLFEVTIFHTAPVRTKDLTDDEIDECRHPYEGAYDFARAVIAKDREKNK